MVRDADDIVHGRDPDADLCRELGELVFAFSLAENALFLIASRLLGSRKKARIILAGVHLSRATNLVKRLVAAEYREAQGLAAFQEAVAKLGECTQHRNQVLHSVMGIVSAADGSELLRLVSVGTGEQLVRARPHVKELATTARMVAARLLGSANELGVFQRPYDGGEDAT